MFFVMELDSLWIWGWRVVGSERARDSRRPEARGLVNGRTEKNNTRAVKFRQKKNARFRCVCTTKLDPGKKNVAMYAFRYRDSNPSLERERLIC